MITMTADRWKLVAVFLFGVLLSEGRNEITAPSIEDTVAVVEQVADTNAALRLLLDSTASALHRYENPPMANEPKEAP